MNSLKVVQEQIEFVDESDLSLLADALLAAEDARRSGTIVGPVVDEIALRRAERRARRSDARRVLRTHIGGAA